MNMKFILNCTNDWATLPKKKIILKAVIWFILLSVASIIPILICQLAYSSQGIDPTQLTKFGGDVSTRKDNPLGQTILLLMVIAPIAEEIIFRLGVSLKRHAVALWVGLLPVTIAAYFYDAYDNWMVMAVTIIAGVIMYGLVMRFTTDAQWDRWRARYLRPVMWLSAIGFGLIHLRAFSVITWMLLPYCLTVCLRPAFLGAAITYTRVNLGFWWGVLLHAANNVPGVLVLLAMSSQ